MVGVLNLDKPSGMTSGAALAQLRRSAGERRVGHAGTLDPMATGVLPVLFGRATLVATWLARAGKEYMATVRFGSSSDTDDAAGTLEPVPVPTTLDAAALAALLPAFVGRHAQRPPAFSAVHVDGERSYKLARRAVAGATALPEPKAREVEVREIELLVFEPAAPGEAGPAARLRVACGSGFYLRALARDIGERLGTAAHLEALVRTRVGNLSLEDAVDLERAVTAGPALRQLLLPVAAVLGELSAVPVEEESIAGLRVGRDVPAAGLPDAEACAIDRAGHVLALGAIRGGRFHPHRLVEAG